LHYGLLVDELKLLTRAVYVIGADDRVLYREIVPEITDQPDYTTALAAARRAAGGEG
jgi:thiol peroxidase